MKLPDGSGVGKSRLGIKFPDVRAGQNGREALPRWMRIGGLDELMLREAETLRLGRGEAESIVLAQRLGCLLAVDDEKARSVVKARASL